MGFIKINFSKKRVYYLIAIIILLTLLVINFSLLTIKTLEVIDVKKEIKRLKKEKELFYATSPKYNAIKEIHRQTNVQNIIAIKNESDVKEKRKKLIGYIWRGDGFPYKKYPSLIEYSVTDKCFKKLMNLSGVDRITISMKHGFKSIVYHFHPKKNNNNILIIYHEGHGGEFRHAKENINKLLKKGYAILLFSMPFAGENSKPVIDHSHFGKMKFDYRHEQLGILESNDFSPLQLFVEPVAVALNYIEKKYLYNYFIMTGYSGGGGLQFFMRQLIKGLKRFIRWHSHLPFFCSLIMSIWEIMRQSFHHCIKLQIILNYIYLGHMGMGENKFK